MSHPNPPSRQPGRSFDDPERPLGADLVVSGPPDSTGKAVAERAKVVAVLRKAEEFMSTSNPPAASDEDRRRALELAAGRIGIPFDEYRRLVAAHPDLANLERKVLEDARARA